MCCGASDLPVLEAPRVEASLRSALRGVAHYVLIVCAVALDVLSPLLALLLLLLLVSIRVLDVIASLFGSLASQRFAPTTS